jgi:FixJ family two-component response regulator
MILLHSDQGFALPGINGLEFQQQLTKAGRQIPTIFATGHGDIPMSVKPTKSGAVEFLTKPLKRNVLLDAIQQAGLNEVMPRAWCESSWRGRFAKRPRRSQAPTRECRVAPEAAPSAASMAAHMCSFSF